ncbi:ankyrin repeat domain-containing protein [Pseudochryseolinea flava]|uniref:Ankyrin repeat domain-containing protein n=1 Tax=Pseudochryseolinea flava TaxID=2059302 RepID=A0A364XZS4_9BACT|nr:ankyrin repeat domain-containing protein [Pseudochryseolinea flava]RAV98972.1 ankyrin repeat domain-containing protein [Pseudochryseolinea flava]
MKTQNMNALKTTLRISLVIVSLMTFACKEKETAAQTSTATSTKVEPPPVDIHTAVITENIDAVKQHIKAGSDINAKDPFGGSSPLISAVLFDKREIAKVLIDAGADLNFKNNDGSTALHVGAFFCRPELVKVLLDKGADKTIKNKYGSTPYESVAAPFNDVKDAYDMMGKVLGPMGLKLDYAYIEKTRPVIATMLK